MTRLRFLQSLPFIVARDGEDDDDAAAAAAAAAEAEAEAAAAAAAAEAAKKKKPAPPTFSKEQQDWLNAQLAEEKRRGKEKADRLILELQTKAQQVSTTEAEKKRIEEQIDQLRGEYLTKEEKNKKDTEAQLKSERALREKAEQTAKGWETLYTEEKIERDLTDAALEHKAYNPEPVRAVLKPNTRITDELDNEGKPTGKKVTRVKVKKAAEGGAVQILEMTPEEAVKDMTERPDAYGNLFNSGAHGGVGSNNHGRQGGGGENGKQPLPRDTREYMAKRAELKKQGKI